jgi:capsular polysaccharide biosynthesis protein
LSMGYFHWMCDFLPRLLLVENELKNSILLLPDNHSSSFVEDTLKVFQIENILKFPMTKYIKCKNAIVPGYVANSGDNNPEIMLKLRDKLFNFYCNKNDKKNYHENIYISRSKAKGRFIINEEEVEKTLSNYGFKTIHFEDYTFSEQIAIAYNAENLIGLHGANLTNIMFMREDTNVMELRRYDDDFNNYYFSLASSFNLNYYYQKCKFNYDSNLKNYNLIVDISELVKNIELLIAKK